MMDLAQRTHADIVTRHFGNRSVAKLSAAGMQVEGLEPTQAGPLYRVARDGKTDLLTFLQITEELGW